MEDLCSAADIVFSIAYLTTSHVPSICPLRLPVPTPSPGGRQPLNRKVLPAAARRTDPDCSHTLTSSAVASYAMVRLRPAFHTANQTSASPLISNHGLKVRRFDEWRLCPLALLGEVATVHLGLHNPCTLAGAFADVLDHEGSRSDDVKSRNEGLLFRH